MITFILKLLELFKYIIRSASYGVIIATVLLLLIPNLRDNNLAALNIFEAQEQTPAPLSYAKAVATAGPAVVNIYSEEIQRNLGYGRAPQRSTRLGSGVIMTEAGYILTNFHVVENADQIVVLLQNGQELSGELIGYDVYTDLAVLKVTAANLPVIPQNANMRSYAGDVVLAIGNPFNLGQTVTQGIISGTGRSSLSTTSYQELLQMDAAINEGNSGGALVNTNGELVGINSRKFINSKRNIQGIFFAVPFQLANKIMYKIIENGRVIRGWLGVDANSRGSLVKGFVIGSTAPNSPARRANLQKGDRVLKIGEVEITSVPQALDLVAETRPGTTLVFDIQRQSQRLQIPVTIGEIKP